MIDTKAIEEHIRGILVALGDDPEREGLKDTRIPLDRKSTRLKSSHVKRSRMPSSA